jgi:hypothetical protein
MTSAIILKNLLVSVLPELPELPVLPVLPEALEGGTRSRPRRFFSRVLTSRNVEGIRLPFFLLIS